MNMIIEDFGIYYGFAQSPSRPTEPSLSTISNWGYDTIVVAATRELRNSIYGPDENWDAGSLISARNADPSRDVLFYVSVGQAETFLDSLEEARSAPVAPDWLGSQIGSGSVHQANFWQPSWLEKLKIQVRLGVDAGATGLFLDVTDASDSFGPNGDLRQGTVAMLNLISDVAAYARQYSETEDFRIVVNRESYRNTVTTLLQTGTALEQQAATRYLTAIDAIIYESVFDAVTSVTTPLSLRLAETYLFRGIPVVMLDNDLHVLANSAQFGFIPSLSQAGEALYNGVPLLNGLGLNRATSGNDVLVGNPLSELLSGLQGQDSLLGFLGNDTLIGGDGSDTLSGGDGDDLIYHDANDVVSNISGGSGTDTFYVVNAAGLAPTYFNLAVQGFEKALLDQFDTTGQSWSQFRFGYDSVWRTDFRAITFDDGKRWVQNFDEMSNQVWVELRDVYTAANGYDYQDTYFDTGARWLRNFDELSNQAWAELRDVYTPSGLYDYQDAYFDNGTRWQRNFDEMGNQAYSESRDAYTSGGLYTYQDIYYKDGSRILRDFDEANAFSWSEHRITSNATGQIVGDLYL